MSNLLYPPFRSTLKLDLGERLRSIIDTDFIQTSNIFNSDLAQVSSLRDSITDLHISPTDLETLQKYYSQLMNISDKFPELVETCWTDNLSGNTLKSTAWRNEIDSVVYQIGSLYAGLTAEYDISADGLKKSCTLFQDAAGCFALLELEALESLMLAQAQETVWLKAVNDGLKDSIQAKLALQVSKFYEQAVRKWTGAGYRNDWLQHLNDKTAYFVAVAEYRTSIGDASSRQYGMEIKRLQRAQQHLSKMKNNSYSLGLQTTVSESLRLAERDNDLIYLQPIPEDVPVIKSAIMVSSKQFFCPQFEPLFKELLPYYVFQAAEAYKERQATYVEEHIIRPLKAMNKLLLEITPDEPLLQRVTNEDKQVLQDALLNISQMSHQAQELLRAIERTSLAPPARLEDAQRYCAQGLAIDDETRSNFYRIDFLILASTPPRSNSPLGLKIEQILIERQQYMDNVMLKSSQYQILPKIVSKYKQDRSKEFSDVWESHIKNFQDDLNYVMKQSMQQRELQMQPPQAVQRNDPRQLFIIDFQQSYQLYKEVQENVEAGYKFYHDLITSLQSLLRDLRGE